MPLITVFVIIYMPAAKCFVTRVSLSIVQVLFIVQVIYSLSIVS